MPEWIALTEAFRMILRSKHPVRPALADEIQSYAWDHFQGTRFWFETNLTSDEIIAVNKTLELLNESVADKKIRLRGAPGPSKPLEDIDSADGKLHVFDEKFEVVRNNKIIRTYYRVHCNGTDIRSLCVKRGRPRKYNWEVIKAETFVLMDHHGDFSPDDPEWNAQARLEEKLANFCQVQYGCEPDSLLREKLPAWLDEWRKGKTQVSTVSENQ
jgi:hypothetical protein